MENSYKPDETTFIITNYLCSKVCKEGEDQENLGRWSYLTLKVWHKSKLTIINGYITRDNNIKSGIVKILHNNETN